VTSRGVVLNCSGCDSWSSLTRIDPLTLTFKDVRPECAKVFAAAIRSVPSSPLAVSASRHIDIRERISAIHIAIRRNARGDG